MSTALLPLAAAGVAVVAIKSSGDGATVPRESARKRFQRGLGLVITSHTNYSPSIYDPSIHSHNSSGHPQEVTDAAMQEMLDDLKRAGRDAKTQVCKDLKKEFPNSPEFQAIDCRLKTNALFQAIVIAATTAAGAAIGGYFGGPVGAKVGAIIGAAVGKVGYDYFTRAYDDSWAEEVVDEIKDGFEAVGDWFGL